MEYWDFGWSGFQTCKTELDEKLNECVKNGCAPQCTVKRRKILVTNDKTKGSHFENYYLIIYLNFLLNQLPGIIYIEKFVISINPSIILCKISIHWPIETISWGELQTCKAVKCTIDFTRVSSLVHQIFIIFLFKFNSFII